MQRRLSDRVNHQAREVALTDRVAFGELAVSKDYKGVPLLDRIHLSPQTLEVGGRPHDSIRDRLLRRQLILKLLLCKLEGEPRLLDADGREKHVVGAARLHQTLERVSGGAVVDGPRVLNTARARRKA